MLKPFSITQMTRVLSSAIVLFSVFLFNFSQAQQTSPLLDGTVIDLSFDEYGKILNKPAGFSLVEGSKYAFSISVAAPKKQHADLKKYFRESLISLKEKLDDPSNTETKLCSLLLGSDTELDNYKKELEDLAAIIAKPDPAAVADLVNKVSSNEYNYLPHAQLIIDCLYGDIFTVSVKGQSATDKYDKDIVLNVPAANYPINQASLLVRIADLKKRFVADYFNKTYAEIKVTVDALKPWEFYPNHAENGIKQLISSREQMIETLLKLDPTNMKVLCDFSPFKEQYSDNNFTSFLTTYPKWFLSWAWYTNGEIRMNPFDFTDPSRVRFQQGHDTVKAKRMDKYVRVGMKRMVDLKSNLQISVADFDSLNRKFKNGDEVYSYLADNEALKKKNNLALTKSQQINRVIDSVSFRVVAEEDKKSYFIKTYDAGNSLRPANPDKKSALSLDKEVELMIYNIKSTETVKVTPEYKDTPDESLAMKQLNELGNLGSGLLAQAAIAEPYVATFKNLVFPAAANLVRVDLPPLKQVEVTSYTKASGNKARSSANSEIQFRERLFVSSDPVEIRLIFFHSRGEDEYDFWSEVEQELKERKVYCAEIIAIVKQKLIAGLNPTSENLSLKASDYRHYIEGKAKHYRVKISQLSAKAIEEYTDDVRKKLTNEYRLLTLAHAMLESNTYILPPKAIKIDDDPASPAYSNIYQTVAVQDASKKVILPLVHTNKADGKVIAKRIDNYKVSQPRWVMASMGLSYAFEKFRRNEAEVKEGKIVNVPDEDQARLVTGLNFYFVPILLTDSRAIWNLPGRQKVSRLSVFVGASFPKPLYNPQLGLSVEPWPGVKSTYGWHFYRKTAQTIVNDQLQNEESKYIYNSPFVSVSIEPLSFVKLIGLIK